MLDERINPTDPLTFIVRCVCERRLLWTYHVNMRMKDRFISREMILESARHYEILESYPDDKYLPSYLIYARYQDTVFHILFAVDLANDNVRIITAYYPHANQWERNFRRRKT